MSINKEYSDIELFDNLIIAIQAEGLPISKALKNKTYIIPLLRIIEDFDEKTIEYLDVNKKLNTLILEPLSDDELFDVYLKAIQSQALGIDAVIRNKNKIIPLLRIIVTYDDDTFAYIEANKRLIILTLEKPSFWKQVFSLR